MPPTVYKGLYEIGLSEFYGSLLHLGTTTTIATSVSCWSEIGILTNISTSLAQLPKCVKTISGDKAEK